jgi:hypothetical protein
VLTGLSHPEAFSPGTCQPHTHISFYLLHRTDDVSLYVVDSNGSIVRTLVVGYHIRKGVRPHDGPWNTWNGRQDNGRLAPDGTYYFRVGLSNQGRTINLTGYPILLKTVAPHPVVTRVGNQLLPQSGVGATIHYAGTNGRVGTVRIYRTDVNPAKPQPLYSFPTPFGGSTVHWDGKVFGRPAPPGVYLMGLDVTDRACNTGHFPPVLPPVPGSTPRAGVTVRYLAAEPPLDPVPAGGKALVLVDSRQRPYRWQLRRAGASRVLATGAATSYRLSVPIPRGSAALYQLAIDSGGYATEVPIVARTSPPRRSGILVVLPALTWEGQNPVDDDGDGMPDTLESGSIQVDRVLANGLPAGFSDQAAFVAYLDHGHLPYDLTTDLGLIDGTAPALAGHSGVVLAGSERWLPDSLAAGLRSYVQGGGRVLSLGIDSLRRGVTVQTTALGARAFSPTAPLSTDAFGGRPGAIAQSTAETLVIRDDLGIFSTTSGAFPGFTSYEPIAPPSSSGPISSAGVTSSAPSIIGYKLGHGVVVEVGLAGFGSGLAHSIDAQELARQLWTVLSH